MRTLLLLCIFFTFQLASHASHTFGGEITWECLSNGKFKFKMHLYTDPTGLPYQFNSEIIQVNGGVLPTTNNGNPISTITMFPNTVAKSLSASNYYIYESDTISLNGTIPSSGWIYSYSMPCCRGGYNDNFLGGSNNLIKSIMYPSVGRTLSNGCYDSSPQFAEMPKVQFFYNIDYISHNITVDADGDSLVYLLDQPLSGSANNSLKIPYRSGYNVNNYTGNGTSNGNIPYSVEPSSGNVAFSYQNGPYAKQFNRVITIDSYRNGHKNATITREMSFNISDTLFALNQPQFSSNLTFNSFGVHYDTIMVGNQLSIPMSLIDTAFSSDTMTLVPFGSSFSSDYFTASNCNDPNDTSCATLSLAPNLNNGIYPSRYEYKGLPAMYFNLFWNPTCYHLNANGGAKTHYFTFGYELNYFSEPIFYRTIAITVEPNPATCNTITSIQSIENTEDKIKLFPNPTTGRFTIQANYEVEEMEVRIRNSNGQLIKTLHYNSYSAKEIEIPGSTGMYFVEFENPKGILEFKKIIKL